MDRTCSQLRARSPFIPSSCNHTTASGKRKTIMQVESLASELIKSFKAINSQTPGFVHVPNTQNLATASEGRKIDNDSLAGGSDNTNNSRTNNTKDFNSPSTHKREQKRAWIPIYENFKQGNFRTSPTNHLEVRMSLSTVAKNSSDMHREAKSESAKEKMMERLEAIGTGLREAEWGHENFRRAGMEEWSTEEQERIEAARDSAIIDYSDDELDSDSDDEDDLPHLYANIPTPSQTPTDDGDDDDFPPLCASTTTPPRTNSLTEESGIATNTAKVLLELVKGPLTPPLTPVLKCSEPESSASSIFDEEVSYLEPRKSFEISRPSRFDIKRELTLITALINDLGERLIKYQDLTDDVFVAALCNANPTPELLSLKSFCSWKLHPISARFKNTLPPATQTVPDLRLTDPDGDVYSLEERVDILDEFEDRDFAGHLAKREEWQFHKERWFLRNSTNAENEERVQHLERWYEEGRAE
jgi:hypothetical protein